MENPEAFWKACPICGTALENYQCTECNINLLEFNLTRWGTLLGYAGNGMQTMSTILVAIIIGLIALIIPLQSITNPYNYLILSSIMISLEVGGYYVFNRYGKYRALAKKFEALVGDFQTLRYGTRDDGYNSLVKDKFVLKLQLMSIGKWFLSNPKLFSIVFIIVTIAYLIIQWCLNLIFF
jgi:hypothetical protein